MSDAGHACLRNAPSMLILLEQWASRGWIRDLDLALAQTLYQRRPDTAAPALLAAALTSHQAGRGHLLLDLRTALTHPEPLIASSEETAAGRPVPLRPGQLLADYSAETWARALGNSAVVGTGPGSEPLVLDQGRLYLRRYWRHEQTITREIKARLAMPVEHDEQRLRELLALLFPQQENKPPGAEWQKLACALAARSRFAVITGGPGTGKTTTVIRLLALQQALALESRTGRSLRIRLAAPTGKAAARLNASIATQVGGLDLTSVANGNAIRAAIPTSVTTLHRMLGARPDTRKFHHNRLRPLPLDLVVVDEASMIDVEMMAALLEALPATAGLVLLGDKDQLASVEAGAVLGSLCSRALQGHYTPETGQWLEQVTGERIAAERIDSAGRPLDQAIGMLRYSHRFASESGIGQLARTINGGDVIATTRILDNPDFTDLHYHSLSGADDPALLRLVCWGHSSEAPGYAACLRLLCEQRPPEGAPREAFDTWAWSVLQAQTAFQLLCALRHGPWGVEGLNPRIEQHLAQHGLVTLPVAGTGQWYEGRPVLVTGNDYGLQLMNGDMGIALRVPVTPGEPKHGMRLRVAFPAGDGDQGIRWVLPSRLQQCETVYAMTVHKSQGSEFRHAALVLPKTQNPVLTRELVYTAVTRAAGHFTLLTPDRSVLDGAVRQPTERASGLFRAIPDNGG